MLFKGKRPVTVLHRKMDAQPYCVCGAPLEPLDGEWVHPGQTKRRRK